MTEATSAPRTIFLSRLIGLVCVLFPLAMITHPQASIDKITAVAHDPPAVLIMGIIGTTAGLALVLSHNLWSGGALTVVITVVGWVILIRGLLLLSLPPATFVTIYNSFHFERFFFGYLAVPFALGIYLTWAGFRASTH